MHYTFYYVRAPLTSAGPGSKTASLQPACSEALKETARQIIELQPQIIFHSGIERVRTAASMFDGSGIRMMEMPELHMDSSNDAEMSRLLIMMKKQGGQALITYIRAGFEAQLNSMFHNVRKATKAKILESGLVASETEWSAGKRANICFLGHMPLLSACIWLNSANKGEVARELKGFVYGYGVRAAEAIVYKRDEQGFVIDWKLISPCR